MSNIGKIIGIGAACSACLAVPAIIAAVGGAGVTGLGLGLGAGWLTLETALCLGMPALLIIGIYLAYRSKKKAEKLACAADGSCGCATQDQQTLQ